ncbi:hypothetical protein [Escherichia coli]|uniref:hypothetical protein n=1 Tax=Escherichia coli TaxID=562 RepID=UPI00211EEFEE|nr:hypothetical protein [Escherichia coli]
MITGVWKYRGESNRVIEAENINDCYDHWMIWAQIAHADITNIRIEELKEHQAA